MAARGTEPTLEETLARGGGTACVVRDPGPTLARVADALHLPGEIRPRWSGDDVPDMFVKYERHELLRSGAISSERIGCWRAQGRTFSSATIETAGLMGYEV